MSGYMMSHKRMNSLAYNRGVLYFDRRAFCKSQLVPTFQLRD